MLKTCRRGGVSINFTIIEKKNFPNKKNNIRRPSGESIPVRHVQNPASAPLRYFGCGRPEVEIAYITFYYGMERHIDAAWLFLSTLQCRCRIEFWPHWISTRGVLIQRAVLRIQRIFHVELRPQRQGVIELRPLRRIKFGPPVELWPRVFIPRWIMTLGINSTLNFDPESWFNVKLWPGIEITI